MHIDTGKSEEKLIKEFLNCTLENIGVNYSIMETPFGKIKLIHNKVIDG